MQQFILITRGERLEEHIRSPNSDAPFFVKQLPSNLEEQWDEVNQAAFALDSLTNTLYSYESARALELKSKNIVLKKNLGGLFFWEVAGDNKPGDGRSLIEVAYRALR